MPGDGQNEDDRGSDDSHLDGNDRDAEREAESGGHESGSDGPDRDSERPDRESDPTREVGTEWIDPASADNPQSEQPDDQPAATAAESPGEATERPTRSADEVFCSSCGEPVKRDAEICPNCGVRQDGASTGDTQEKNPGIAAIASFFFPGLGDVYNGEFARGAVIFVGWFVGGVIWALVVGVIGILTLGIGLLAAPLYALVNFVSAYLSYKRAERINAGEIQV